MTVTKMTAGKHKGEFRARIQPVDKITGKQFSMPVRYARTKREAKALEQDMWNKFQTGYAYNAQKDLFKKCFAEYIRSENERGRWSNNTYRTWKYTSRVIIEYFPQVKLCDVNEQMIRKFAREFVRKRHLVVNNKSSVARCLNHMRSFFAGYVGKVFDQNPVPQRALEKFFRLDEMTTSNERYVLKANEIEVLLSKIKQELDFKQVDSCVSRMAIYIDLLTGMRPQEIQALRWKNLCKTPTGYAFRINDSWDEHGCAFNGHLKAHKRGEERITLPIDNEAKALLDEYHKAQRKFLKSEGLRNKNGLVFLNLVDYQKCSKGYPVTQTALNKMLRKLSTKVGINARGKRWSMYSLRHTVATKLGSTPGMSYPWAAARLGHRLDEFMGTYVHEDVDVDAEMVAKWKAVRGYS